MVIMLALVVLLIGTGVLVTHPGLWLWFGLWMVVSMPSAWYYMRSQETKRSQDFTGMAEELRALSKGFTPIRESYLSTRADEYVFYERGKVQLREYRSAGRQSSGGYGGASYRVSKNLSVSGGGIKATSKALPDESKTIDVGTAVFSNQRVVFFGANYTREWELSKLLGLDVSDDGYLAVAAVSGRQKTSALAGDCLGMITPGFAFALAAALYQEGDKQAQELAADTARKIEARLRR